jgi:hypothetical protein
MHTYWEQNEENTLATPHRLVPEITTYIQPSCQDFNLITTTTEVVVVDICCYKRDIEASPHFTASADLQRERAPFPSGLR